MDIIKEWADQSAFLASILAGFAVAATVQLISMGDNRRVAFWATTAFILSAAILLAATAATSLILMRWEYWQQVTLPQESLHRIFQIRLLISRFLVAGLMAFLAGLGIAGWIRSRAVGLVSSCAAVVTALIVIWLIKVIP
jgi:hypothetical protein